MTKPPMDDEARRLLEFFARTSNLSTGMGSLHVMDWAKLHEFIVHVHMRRLPIGEQDVINALFGYGIIDETAAKLGGWFDEASRLLRLYDERRREK